MAAVVGGWVGGQCRLPQTDPRLKTRLFSSDYAAVVVAADVVVFAAAVVVVVVVVAAASC